MRRKGGSIEEDAKREIKERRENKEGKEGAKGRRMSGGGKRTEKQEKMKQYTFVGEDQRKRK